jgi:aryl-alcohol dehydrogenase-like predicted oxidoreductase
MKVLLSGSTACGQKRETEGMMKPFASCRRAAGIYSPSRRLGYGAMRLTGQPGNFGPYEAREDGEKVLKRAVDLGINFIDTARAYGPDWNERLIAQALHPYPEGLFIATKGGVAKSRPMSDTWMEVPMVCDVTAKKVSKTYA